MKVELRYSHIGGSLHLELAPEIDRVGTAGEGHGGLVPAVVVLVGVGAVVRVLVVRRSELHLSGGEHPS